MAFFSFCSRAGGASAPWIVEGLIYMHPVLPFYLLGGLSITAGLLCCSLKETVNTETKETLE